MVFTRKSPSKLLIRALNYIQKGKALDLGSGNGINSVFLAKKGFTVTAIDNSKEQITKLTELSDMENINININQENIISFKPKEKFDLIISIATLHFLGKMEIINLIEKIKNCTDHNGLNVISAFTDENPKKTFPHLFKKNELKDFYKDWNILYYEEFLGELEKHDNSDLHKHAFANLIAKKPDFL